MPGFALSALFAVAIAKAAFAQPDPADPTPLTDKHYAYPTGIVSPPKPVSSSFSCGRFQPYQVDYNTAAIRGPQYGFNICNSTTQNQNSNCQTIMVNNIGGGSHPLAFTCFVANFSIRLLSLGTPSAQLDHW